MEAEPRVGMTEVKTPETLHRDSWHQMRNISRLFLLIEGCLGDLKENILFFYVLTLFWLRDFWRPDILNTFLFVEECLSSNVIQLG